MEGTQLNLDQSDKQIFELVLAKFCNQGMMFADHQWEIHAKVKSKATKKVLPRVDPYPGADLCKRLMCNPNHSVIL